MMGSGSNPRDVAMLIAAQARAPVDCPTLQCIGPQATNQAVKAIAIARTFLKESQSTDSSLRTCHPVFVRARHWWLARPDIMPHSAYTIPSPPDHACATDAH